MSDGEQVGRSLTGLLEGQPMSADLTDHHLVVHYRGEPEPGLVVDVGQILRVEQASGLLSGSLTLVLVDRKISLTRAPKGEVVAMAGALRERIRTGGPADPPPQVDAGSPSPLEDLERLGRLHDSGVLTDAEFAAAKATLLDRL